MRGRAERHDGDEVDEALRRGRHHRTGRRSSWVLMPTLLPMGAALRVSGSYAHEGRHRRYTATDADRFPVLLQVARRTRAVSAVDLVQEMDKERLHKLTTRVAPRVTPSPP